MKMSYKILFLLTTLFLSLSVNTVSSSPGLCSSPESTVTDFYKWYLQEVNNDKYPLISKNKENLNKWVSPLLLKKINDEMSSGELDADYFTDAQDMFDDWMENIHAHTVKLAGHEASVDLALGISNIKREYDITLDDASGCWKISRVLHKQ